jgi:hypothetical protein
MSAYEMELEFEEEYEGEEEGEEFLGTIGRIAGGLLGGQGEYEQEYEAEFEGEGEYEWELEGEFEGEFEGEEFFRRIGGFLRRAAPVLRNVARVAAPLVGTAVGGPLGGMLGRAAASALGEGEFEGEFEGEYEGEFEGEYEGEFEAMAATPPTPTQAQGEYMAAVASRAQTEAEAEAMIGAAAVATISPADRAALRGVLPHIVRGTAILTRILRRRPITRPAVRVVPTIVQRTATTLARQAQATGRPPTRRAAARVMATQTRRVLANPRTCGTALQRNARATTIVRRQAVRPAVRATGAARRPARY